MIALLDGDIYLYRSAVASEEESLEVAIERLDRALRTTLEVLQTDQYRLYISGSDNFRYDINPEYKANRRDKVDPKWREALKLYCLEHWNAEITHRIEADDAMGIAQDADTIIVTIDKDLNMIPGSHYNFVKDTWLETTGYESKQFFYEQLLIGDRADNIRGIDRIGPVKAKRAMDACESEEQMFKAVRELYNDDERLMMNARCLWIQRYEEDDWVESEFGKILNEDLGLKSVWKKNLNDSE